MNPFILFFLTAMLAVGCAGQPSANSSLEAEPSTNSASPITEASPVAQAEKSQVLRRGTFVNGEHPTQGDVRIIREGDQRFLEFGNNFKTDNGPALVVVLHRAADVIGSTQPPAFPLDEGDYVVLEPLQNVEGAQRYAIPADVNLDNYLSAAVWCRQFNATFGAASLQG